MYLRWRYTVWIAVLVGIVLVLSSGRPNDKEPTSFVMIAVCANENNGPK